MRYPTWTSLFLGCIPLGFVCILTRMSIFDCGKEQTVAKKQTRWWRHKHEKCPSTVTVAHCISPSALLFISSNLHQQDTANTKVLQSTSTALPVPYCSSCTSRRNRSSTLLSDIASRAESKTSFACFAARIAMYFVICQCLQVTSRCRIRSGNVFSWRFRLDWDDAILALRVLVLIQRR